MGLRNDTRQKNTQIILDFHSAPTGEARSARGEETEPFPAAHAPESPASTNQLMEEVCERENLKHALQQVKANKGSPGIDGPDRATRRLGSAAGLQGCSLVACAYPNRDQHLSGSVQEGEPV